MSLDISCAIDKSESDKKSYRFLVLPNKIKVLLVSDPSPIPNDDDDNTDSENEDYEEECDESSICSTSTERESSEEYDSEEEGDERLAACALMVDVGSFSDPHDVQGLSHFLEHMIFMGSEKFPEENSYDAHIKKCGGFDNADTECEETSFYFEVPDDYLESSIERFAALFTAPLLKKEAMTRERESVESEFQESLQDDEQRRNQILASELANKNHPCSIFTWGNLKTLKDNIDDEALHKKLVEFQKRHYSSHRMFCCVQARLPLDELESYVTKYLSQIPNNNLPAIDFGSFSHENAFTEEFYQNVIFMKPVNNTIKIDISWCLPSLINEYRTKPQHYLSYILGYEGVGSLCAYLRKKLWALELICGIDDAGFEFNSMYSLFNICIYLTENGFENIDQVLSTTFSYLKLLKDFENHKFIYEELQCIEDTHFRFQTERSAFDNVQDLVINMKYYPVQDILTGPHKYFEYNEESIKKLIDIISSNKFNLMITSQIKYENISYDKIENWFGTEFCSIKMPEKWIKAYETAEIIPELHFPKPNEFIAKDFSIYSQVTHSEHAPHYPKKIIDTEICELWFKQDNKFLLPEAYLYFYFITPLALQSSKNAVLLALYCQIIKFHLDEELYPASIAGLSYQFYPASKGIVLKVSGYNEKLPIIVNSITQVMKRFKDIINDEILQVFIVNQQKNYYNSILKPKTLNKDIRLKIIEHIRWSIYEKFNLIKTITLDEINQFASILFNEIKIQALMQGNLTEEIAHNIMNSVLTILDGSKIQDKKSIETKTCELPYGCNYIYCNSINQNDVNSVVTNFYQIGPSTLKTECILDLLMTLVEEPLFDILRTKEQLGYDVSATVRNNNGILAYSITVNSQENKVLSKIVDERIEAFRLKMMETLNEMEEDEYEQHKDGLIKAKQVSDNELKDEVSRNWNEIVSEEYIFDRLKREVECLRTIVKQDIIDFCVEYETQYLKKLSVQVVGLKNGSVEKIQKEISETDLNNPLELSMSYNESSNSTFNLEELKNSLNVYPVTKTLMDFSSHIIENHLGC